MKIVPYYLERTNIPEVYKMKLWGTYREPTPEESIELRVNSISDKAMAILKARENLPPLTLRGRLNKIRFKLNYHFNRIFK